MFKISKVLLKIPKLDFKAPKLIFKMQKLVFKTQKLISPAFSLQVVGWIPHKKFFWFVSEFFDLPNLFFGALGGFVQGGQDDSFTPQDIYI